LSVRIFYNDVDYRLKRSGKIVTFIKKVIVEENRFCGDLNFIFVNDAYLREMNVKFLNHDYFTDVITFNYNDGEILNGEIYISFERVKINSELYSVELKNEILRIMIHGVLHLIGFNDKMKKEKLIMKNKEDYWLEIYEKFYGEGI
jgi:probable rRNA maturation factor